MIRTFNIQNFTEQQLVDSQETETGVVVGRTIAFDCNPLVKIVNTTEEIKIISNNGKFG